MNIEHLHPQKRTDDTGKTRMNEDVQISGDFPASHVSFLESDNCELFSVCFENFTCMCFFYP